MCWMHFHSRFLRTRGLIQPYASPEAAAYPDGYKDLNNHWATLYCAYNVFSYNTKLVSPGEAPKDWEDLLHPRWKGKLAIDDQDYYWYAGMLKFWGEEKGRKYMEALARHDLNWRVGRGLLTELTSTGEFEGVVVTFPDLVEQMKAKGQSVEWVKTTNPILVTLDMMGLPVKAPRPNAGKLFMNYSISKEGQEHSAQTASDLGAARYQASGPRDGPNEAPPGAFGSRNPDGDQIHRRFSAHLRNQMTAH